MIYCAKKGSIVREFVLSLNRIGNLTGPENWQAAMEEFGRAAALAADIEADMRRETERWRERVGELTVRKIEIASKLGLGVL